MEMVNNSVSDLISSSTQHPPSTFEPSKFDRLAPIASLVSMSLSSPVVGLDHPHDGPSVMECHLQTEGEGWNTSRVVANLGEVNEREDDMDRFIGEMGLMMSDGDGNEVKLSKDLKLTKEMENGSRVDRELRKLEWAMKIEETEVTLRCLRELGEGLHLSLIYEDAVLERPRLKWLQEEETSQGFDYSK